MIVKKSMSKKLICIVVSAGILAPNAVYAENAVTKDESVYVNLNETGDAKEEIVSDWLHSNNGGINIKDQSNLSGIKNIKGNEKPEQSGSDLIWKSDSSDIFYEGRSNAELPLKVKVTYFFNGEQFNPKDIAGKSGSVRIKLNFINNACHQEIINGKLKNIYTPMATLAVVSLPMDTFRNVTVSDGQIISEGNNQLVNFIGFPGMEESLGIGNMNLGVKLPENLEITADAENFKMGPILITATPKLPDMQKLKDASSIDELKSGISDLKDATGKLLDGADKLNQGIQQAQSGASKVNDGLSMARQAVENAEAQLAQNGDKLDLVKNQDNVAAENRLISDAFNAMNIDTSLAQQAATLMTNQNLALAQKTGQDYENLNLPGMLKDPLFQELRGLMTKDNLKNVTTLLNDTDSLLSALPAASRLKPLAGPLTALLSSGENLDKLNNLLADAQNLYSNKTAVISSLSLLNGNNLSILSSLIDDGKVLNDQRGTLQKLTALINPQVLGKLSPLIDDGKLLYANKELINKLTSLLDSSVIAKLTPLIDDGASLYANRASIKYITSNDTIDKLSGLINATKAINDKNINLSSILPSSQQEAAQFQQLAQSNTPQNVAVIKAAISNFSSLSDDQKAQLAQMIDGYSGLTTKTANFMTPDNITTLTNIESQVTSDKELINNVSAMLPGIRALNINSAIDHLTAIGDMGLLTSDTKTLFSALPGLNLQKASSDLNAVGDIGLLSDDTKALLGTLPGLNLDKALSDLNKAGDAGLISDNVKAVISVLPSLKLNDTINDLILVGDSKIGQVPLLSAVQGLISSGKANSKDIQAVTNLLNNVDTLQNDVNNNAENLQVIQALLQKANDPAAAVTLEKVKVLQADLSAAKPVIDKLKSQITPDNVNKLSAAPKMVNQLTLMQKDLVNNKKILEVVQDSLKEGNIKMANQLISAIPSLTNGVNQLSTGSQQLLDGLNQLSAGSQTLYDGMNKFNTQGVSELDAKLTPTVDSLQDILAAKDALVKLSENYGDYSGKGENMDGVTKFIMKTDEVKLPDKKTDVNNTVSSTKQKTGFWQWLKNLFK